MIDKLSPSKEMWEYYFEASWKRKEITPLSVASAIADKLAGYRVSYTANEVLKDLGLLKANGDPNKKAIKVLSHYLHEKFHRGVDGVEIVPPEALERVDD